MRWLIRRCSSVLPKPARPISQHLCLHGANRASLARRQRSAPGSCHVPLARVSGTVSAGLCQGFLTRAGGVMVTLVTGLHWRFSTGLPLRSTLALSST
jgi:hypothetical protein